MSREIQFPVGPPDSQFIGMATSYKRQQIPMNAHWMLRNLRLSGEALERRKGTVRLVAGARMARSLSSDGSATTWVAIPTNDASVDTGDFALGTHWTIFASYQVDDFGDDVLVCCSEAGEAAPGYMIRHNNDHTITATVSNSGGTTISATTAADYGETGVEIQVQLVRTGASFTLYVNGVSAATGALLDPRGDTKAAATATYLGSYSGRATGSEATWYEFRIHREAITSEEWRATQYPWGGRFGDPNLVVYNTFEDGSGTSLTDWSRNNHQSISLAGAGWTWNSTTARQVVTPVTGIHVMEVARGRKWLIADIGVNHYRIPLN